MCTILLVDMNAFYASVHQVLEPLLQGQPVIVCGDPEKRHGIVLAASYEAKKFGVKTTMPKWEAERLVPNAVFLKPEHQKYAEFSDQIMNILRDFTPLVEPSSIDEAYLDVGGCSIFGDSLEIARKIKKRIKEEVGVLCSVGIGPNKLIAKMAAEYKKPDGLTLVRQEDFPNLFWDMPVQKLFGVGRSTAKKLHAVGIHTIGQLAIYPVDLLEKRFGKHGLVIHLSANGQDYNSVNPASHEIMKSIGNQLTLGRDLVRDEVLPVLTALVEKVGFRVRQGGYVFRTVSLLLKDTNFTNHSWSVTLTEPVDITEEIYNNAKRLLCDKWPINSKIRLIGVTVSNLSLKKFQQMEFFTGADKLQKLNQTCDEIKKKFGMNSLVRGNTLNKKKEKEPLG